jgi:hypothetical protein
MESVTVSPYSGFTGTVNFACSGLPTETTCSFSPVQVTGSGFTMMTIATTPIGQRRHRASIKQLRVGWLAISTLPLLGICLVGIPARRWRRVLAFLITAASLGALLSCGSGGGGGGGGTTPNPVPTISSISPTQVAAGSQVSTIVVNGTGFVSSSNVTYNGQNRPVTFISSTEVEIHPSGGDSATIGTFPVVITNPAPGGGTSNPVSLDVTTGTPTGTFNVTVTATSGSLTHSTTFVLAVQ